jgi:Ser/Thr protein kinase RdoA (MazF antagonist)
VRSAIRSVTYPAAIDAETRNRVLEAFDLEVEGHKNVRHNRRSRNLFVDTPQGKVVLKRYRPDWQPHTVTCVHSVLTELERLGEPAPRLLRTHQGADFVAQPDGVFAVFEFVPGISFSSSYLMRRHRLLVTAEAAKALARMHLALVDFQPAGEHHHGIDPETGDPRRDLNWHIDMVEDLKYKSEGIRDDVERELGARLAENSNRLLETLADLDALVGSADLPTTVIHGDFGIHNLIFPRGSEPVPIDFELSRRDWRINDLISAVGKHRYKGGDYDLESMRVFLQSYDRAFGLSASERGLMAETWAHYKLRAAVQYWNSYFLTGGPTRKLRSALDSMAQAEGVIDDPSQIRSLARR